MKITYIKELMAITGRHIREAGKEIASIAARKHALENLNKERQRVIKKAAKVRVDNLKRTRLTMYDSTNPGGIPKGAAVVAGYIDGTWSDYDNLCERFPKARHVSITTQGNLTADMCDIENGDLTPREGVDWTIRRLGRVGALPPILYADLSEMQEVISEMEARKIPRDRVRLLVADPTGMPHIPEGYDGCQYLWNGQRYDMSLLEADFFD